MIARDLLYREMTVVIDDREIGNAAMIEIARDVGLEEEVVVNEHISGEWRVGSGEWGVGSGPEWG